MGCGLFAALLAAVLPLNSFEADATQSPVAVELGSEPDCQWLLTRLIDLDRCAEAPRAMLDAAHNPTPAPISPTLVTDLDATVTAAPDPRQLDVSEPDLATAAVDPAPCPTWSIEAVFADPAGDWDGDEIANLVELYDELDPCTVDELPEFEYTPYASPTVRRPSSGRTTRPIFPLKCHTGLSIRATAI